MARRLKSDKALLMATLLLVGLSVVMVYSASAVQAANRYSTPTYFLYKQIVWAVMGLILLLVARRVDYGHYRRPAMIWSLLGVTIVLLIAALMSDKVNGTHRWVSFRVMSVQPSELAKLAAILFTAALLERRMHRVNDVIYAIAPIAMVTVGLAGLIVIGSDLGTAAVLIAIVGTMLFAAGLSYRYLFGSMLLLLPVVMVLIVTADYRLRRILSFLDPWKYELGDGFQIIQSLLAIGSGGVFGKGLMAGVQKLYYIPEPHTDFIYAVIAEEFGLIGTTLTLACFVLIAWRGLRVSLLAPDRFGALLALGVTLMIVLQAFVNISVVTAIAPTKGIPLPFVSNGGSSLLINMIAMGILLNVSQQVSLVSAGQAHTGEGLPEGVHA
jgi:cell division protein FtsW